MTRTDPLSQLEAATQRGGPTLRPVAQRSLVAGATFDSILSERREPPAPAEPPVERDRAPEGNRDTPEPGRDRATEQDAERTDSERPGTDTGRTDSSDKAGPQTPESGARAGGGRAPEASSDQPAPVRSPDGQSPESARPDPARGVPGPERSDARAFIALHGRKAAKLRWDSAGVQLSHAAEVSLAEKNARELATRARPTRLDGPASALTQPADAREIPQATSRTHEAPARQQGASPTGAGGVRTGSVDPVQTQQAPTDPVATRAPGPEAASSVAGAHGSPVRPESQRQGPRSVGDREALIARLASTGSAQAHASKLNAGRVTAINALGKSGARADAPSGAGALRQTSARDQTGVLRQVQQGLARLLKGEGGSTTLRLNPQSLGEVTVHLRVHHGKAEARLTPTNDVARSLLQSGLKELKATLETRGLRVERLTVDPVPHRASAEPATEPRAESRETRAGDGAPLDQRQDAEDSPGGSRGSPQQHPGHGRAGHARTGDDSRSEDARGPQRSDDVPEGTIDAGWLRLDTVA
ncbi:MAG: flagellar hook-length control protein FliK [Phycisphaerales bacterium JB040]